MLRRVIESVGRQVSHLFINVACLVGQGFKAGIAGLSVGGHKIRFARRNV